jgi:hypothetical protein
MQRTRDKHIRAISKQCLGKHVPATTNRRATIEILLEKVYHTRSVPKAYKEDNWGNQYSSVRESEPRIVQLEGGRRSERT